MAESREANQFSASQEITRILLNPKFHSRIHKFPPPVSILNQLDPAHTPHPTSIRPILISSSHLRLAFASGRSLSLNFRTKTLYTPALSPIALHAPPISFSIVSPEKY